MRTQLFPGEPFVHRKYVHAALVHEITRGMTIEGFHGQRPFSRPNGFHAVNFTVFTVFTGVMGIWMRYLLWLGKKCVIVACSQARVWIQSIDIQKNGTNKSCKTQLVFGRVGWKQFCETARDIMVGITRSKTYVFPLHTYIHRNFVCMYICIHVFFVCVKYLYKYIYIYIFI